MFTDNAENNPCETPLDIYMRGKRSQQKTFCAVWVGSRKSPAYCNDTLQIYEREWMVAYYVSISYSEAKGTTDNENEDDNKKASVLFLQANRAVLAAALLQTN